jgi:hypothetical protein
VPGRGRHPFPSVRAVANDTYSSTDREFHRDRFAVPPGLSVQTRILLLDDTWTSGGRLQSLAFALKDAGAGAVGAVVLGRHVNPGFGPSASMMERIRSAEFNLERCCIEP